MDLFSEIEYLNKSGFEEGELKWEKMYLKKLSKNH